MANIDYTKWGTVKINNLLIEEFKKIEGNFNNASHKFYTVRKKVTKMTGCDVFMNVQPTDFFEALKKHNHRAKREQEIIQRRAETAKRMEKWNKSYNGDFDDMGYSNSANAYFEGNKRRHGLM